MPLVDGASFPKQCRVVDLGIFWIELERLVIVRDGPVEVALRHQALPRLLYADGYVGSIPIDR